MSMHPSTILTPPDWRHVSIQNDAGGRFKLAGYASAQPWLPGDLKALGVKIKGNVTWGLTKERAVEIGQLIEDGMIKQNGQGANAKVRPVDQRETAVVVSASKSGAQKDLF